jgi:hypothetical protein
MQMGERPALQQCQENDRLQPPGSNSLTFATKSAHLGSLDFSQRCPLIRVKLPSPWDPELRRHH